MPDPGQHRLYIVGAGTGGHESLTEAARTIIGRCRFVAAGVRLLPLAEELATGAETHAIGADLEAVRRFVATSLTQGDVCVLTSGDPGCFSILPFLKEHFPGAIKVTPGISAAQALAARLAVPWNDWRLVSLHGRGGGFVGAAADTAVKKPSDPVSATKTDTAPAKIFATAEITAETTPATIADTAPAKIFTTTGMAAESTPATIAETTPATIAGTTAGTTPATIAETTPATTFFTIPDAKPATTLYFCDNINTPQAIAAALLNSSGNREAVVAAALGEEQEQIATGTLEEIAAGSFPGHSLLLVIPARPAKEKPLPGTAGTRHSAGGNLVSAMTVTAPGIPDDLWLRADGVPLSKSEMRAVLLAKAQPAGRRVIWDLGAGTGSYGIECSLLAPRAQVIAVERNPAACHLIGANAERFGARVEVVCAEAPEGLETLAPPDLVIIGGSGGMLGPIFKAAQRALLPGGRLLVTALLAETKKAAHELFAASGFGNRAATRVSIARGKAHDWEEQNPVIIFTGDKTT